MLYGLLNRGVAFDPENDIPDLAGKVIFITGGNVGLGKETVLQLSKHNPAHIYLSTRNESKAVAAIQDIQPLVPNAPITFVKCDLSFLPSIQSAARDFLSRETRLDVLILNAGIMACPAGITEQGYEIQFGTNHMGHALLTKLLLPTLLSTAEAQRKEGKAPDVRIVSLASIGHIAAPISGIRFNELKFEMRTYPTLMRYGQSKLANILFAKELATRYGEMGITAVAVHPGIVNTELYRSIISGWFGIGRIVELVKSAMYTNVKDGAKGQLWAATSPLKGESRSGVESGQYYTPVGVTGQGSWLSGDMELAERLWEWTEKELAGWTL